MSAKTIDMTGKVFGRLTVIGFARKTPSRDSMWNCLCECGGSSVVSGSNLRKGHAESCGCMKSSFKPTHGMRHSREYKTWQNMRSRCQRTNNAEYENYGGRGIRVCSEWGAFENFIRDMGACPSQNHSIDRIDNNGNYEKSNCRWATREVQSANRRAFKGSKSGVLGVSWSNSENKWLVQLRVNKKRVFRATFSNLDDAIAARKDAELRFLNKGDSL